MRTRALSIPLVIGALAAAGACSGPDQPATVPPHLEARQATPASDPATRGRYLVDAIGCQDCHTPKKMGPQGHEPVTAMLLAGHAATDKLPPPPALPPGPWVAVGTGGLTAWSGPWGISYAANLTPDAETGLGHWTEEMFVNAMRSGKHMGASRPILPPMPWQWYRNLSDEDLRAIFAYLRTIPPVSNRVPDPVFASQP